MAEQDAYDNSITRIDNIIFNIIERYVNDNLYCDLDDEITKIWNLEINKEE